MGKNIFSKMEEIKKERESFLIDTFTSIPVRIDPNLDGTQYYMMISPTMYVKVMAEKQNKRMK